jgi:4a-hydroxytetrahydrobiopterin dehydratase
MALADLRCVPCKGGIPPLTADQYAPLLAQLDGWEVQDGRKLVKRYRFKDFVQAVDFVNAVTPVVEEEGHHPDLYVAWGRVEVYLWTHKIDGLTESDFYMAAKIDRVHDQSKSRGEGIGSTSTTQSQETRRAS